MFFKPSQELRAEARKHSITVEAYVKFFSDRGIDILEEDCYDPYTDTCSGGCQGASDCPIAEEFWTGKRATPYRIRNYNVMMELTKPKPEELKKISEILKDIFK